MNELRNKPCSSSTGRFAKKCNVASRGVSLITRRRKLFFEGVGIFQDFKFKFNHASWYGVLACRLIVS